MIRSMTAFARQPIECEWGVGAWEIRSVNSRYLETNFRLPEAYRYLEFRFRELIRSHLQRGKVDVSLKVEAPAEVEGALQINHALARQLLSAHEALQQLAGIEQAPNLTRLLSYPGVLAAAEVDSEQVEQALLTLLQQAVTQLIAAREREGQSMVQIITARLDAIDKLVEKVRAQMPAIMQWQRERLLTRFEEARLEVDEQRLEQELVLVAQKIDVDEELDRLQTHVNEVRRLLKKGGPCGRRLDFLMQELNREANTLGSKSINAETTAASVELKVLIEQMREQIQNIE